MSTLVELFIVFFKLGAFTIGGGIAMLPLLQNSLIHEKKWFTEEEFVDAVAICQGLPGIIAVNMATYVGYKKRGLLGSAVSTFAVVMPVICADTYHREGHIIHRRQSMSRVLWRVSE